MIPAHTQAPLQATRTPRLSVIGLVIVSGEQSPKIPRKFGYMKKPFRLEALFDMLGIPHVVTI